MKLQEINAKYVELQEKYGDKDLDTALGDGQLDNPEVCFIFMNPTKKNIATSKYWKGLKSQWIGTKQVWKFFYSLNLLSKDVNDSIQAKKSKDWDYAFAERVYKDVRKHNFYITNLGKCTQIDARPLKDSIFNKYIKLLEEEIYEINPKKIICFGNQVSSLFLGEKISVSQVRQKRFVKTIKDKDFETYSVYYPVGNGFFNIGKVMEDLPVILKSK